MLDCFCLRMLADYSGSVGDRIGLASGGMSAMSRRQTEANVCFGWKADISAPVGMTSSGRERTSRY